ncbi:MAG: hypothetical protein QE164_02375 [Candidatus Nezhaarchaeota archaeon]|nr:hypothetical protein [Candidatus Nezhaarchaeota archaeon]
MLKSVSVEVPVCIIGQSLAQYNYPVLCYLSEGNRLLISLNQGIGRVRVEWPGLLAAYLEEKLSKALSPYLRELGLDVRVGGRALPPIDSLVAVLHAVLREVGREEALPHSCLRRLAISEERARIVLEATRVKGLTAYRRGEGLMELRKDFPWKASLCVRAPFRFKLAKFKDFEEPLNVAMHALGRLIVVVARSIIDGDFELFREALVKYSKLSLAISDLPLTVLRIYEKLSRIEGVACKIDEDFRGFMLFSERTDLLNDCLSMASRMGFQVLSLEG